MVSCPTSSSNVSVNLTELQSHYFTTVVMDSMKKTYKDSSPVVNHEQKFFSILSHVPIVGSCTAICPDYLSFFQDCGVEFLDSKTPLSMIAKFEK